MPRGSRSWILKAVSWCCQPGPLNAVVEGCSRPGEGQLRVIAAGRSRVILSRSASRLRAGGYVELFAVRSRARRGRSEITQYFFRTWTYLNDLRWRRSIVTASLSALAGAEVGRGRAEDLGSAARHCVRRCGRVARRARDHVDGRVPNSNFAIIVDRVHQCVDLSVSATSSGSVFEPTAPAGC
jgi:hypothetical protein